MAAAASLPVSGAPVPVRARVNPATWSLMQLLKPEMMVDPYPFYAKLRAYEPVHWDALLHSWVVTSYAESLTALLKYKAARTPDPEALEAMGLSALEPYARLLLKQLMFMDAPQHTRLRGLCAVAFTPKRVETLRTRMQALADDLLDGVAAKGTIDVVNDFAAPLPGLMTTAMLGVDPADHARLKVLAENFSELVGNFDHEPERMGASVRSLQAILEYLAKTVEEQRAHPREGLISSLLEAEIDGARLTDEEVIANVTLVLAGGLLEATNLIGGGMLTLLERPESLAQLRDEPGIVNSAVEELVRWQSPTQHTGRVAPEDVELGGKTIRKGDGLTIVIGAANRDPLRFPNPERLDLKRTDNKHLGFGYAAHYCMGAPLARMTAQIALTTLLRRLPGLALTAEKPVWRQNIGLRGLMSLPVTFDAAAATLLRVQ